MQLKQLLQNMEYTLLQGSLDKDIEHIVFDSRQVVNGDLFVCIPGFETDGHIYATTAVQKGASVLLVQKKVLVAPQVTVIQVGDTRKSMALLSAVLYDDPSESLNLIGVTGTNGKTSTVFLIKYILEAYGHKTGMIGTIENRIGNRVLETSRTTPESVQLQSLFKDMVDESVDSCIMEVSSHALDLHRVTGCHFKVGIFTNLSLDHLDYHKTMENYRDAKAKLFELVPIGVINIDDHVGIYIKEKNTCGSYLTYGCNNESADLNAYNISHTISGSRFSLDYEGRTYQIRIQTPGQFSVYNALAAIGATLALDVPMEIVQETLGEKSIIRGRFESIRSQNGIVAIVDYAHTPDGLENVLKTINEFSIGRIITVFGCGGDRDKSKRPQMGRIAGELSDYAIITSDNPRTEDPAAILREVEAGIFPTECPYEMHVDRREAVEKAILMANPEDVILIAGKGHEDYQVIGKEKFHFDDLEEVRRNFDRISKDIEV